MTLVETRMKIMREMDEYLRKNDPDETTYLDIWLFTFPDECDDDELREIAEIDACWLDVVNCFARCCRCLGVIE